MERVESYAIESEDGKMVVSASAQIAPGIWVATIVLFPKERAERLAALYTECAEGHCTFVAKPTGEKKSRRPPHSVSGFPGIKVAGEV